jgi:hypothetical protein
MKILTWSFLILLATFSRCNNDSDAGKGYYDSMHFVRQGGGQIDFKVYATDNSDKLRVIVSKYNFRDTTIQIVLENNPDDADAFSSFHSALNNQTLLNGDFKQSTLKTGTWSYVYFVLSGTETEVTNTALRNSLLKFEHLTTSAINK